MPCVAVGACQRLLLALGSGNANLSEDMFQKGTQQIWCVPLRHWYRCIARHSCGLAVDGEELLIAIAVLCGFKVWQRMLEVFTTV